MAGLPGAPQFHLATGAGTGFAVPPLTGMPTPPDVSAMSSLADVSGVPAGPTHAAGQLANTAIQHAQMIATLAQQHTPRADNHTPNHDTAGATNSGEHAAVDAGTAPPNKTEDSSGEASGSRHGSTLDNRPGRDNVKPKEREFIE
ncbi:hypothetical protein DAVIS_03915 [Mycobacterium marinum]|uniref:Uncharacterized protein n=1 Tax=Mycobacterium marinum TaxID=1781 RepID=A0A3E2MSA6_MYCMR|nr:hypothetical protein [Mycobacterium marinum]RFZ37150.1 hypothetical protein DAVIS_03915 [Mycobacterium marinum]GJO56976.1 hypothetical protein NJB1604_49300 [Mycobacterium marinum]